MATVAWQPRQEGVDQIVSLLTQYQQASVDHAQIFAQLQHCSSFPDFNNYLVFIFSSGESYSVEVRQSAGLLLKNNLKTAFLTTAPEFQAFIKHHVLRSLGTDNPNIRSTTGTIVSVIAVTGGIANWPEMTMAVAQCLYSEDPNHMEGALDALFKICEDIPGELDKAVQGLTDTPANMFIPRLLALFKSPHPQIRRFSIGCVNQMLTTMPRALYGSQGENLQLYLNELFSLRNDQHKEVRKLVCSGLVLMLSVQPEILYEHLHELIQFMLQSTQDPDPEVALESCEFWSAFCESHLPENYAPILKGFLPQLIPVLLRNMAYDEHEEEVINAEAAESHADCPDRDQDIKPFFMQKAAVGEGGEEEEEEEEVNTWNLRKCSAASLDILSSMYGDELLQYILPIVQERLSDADWKMRESAILAVGAVAEGCAHGLLGFLAQLVQFLIPMLEDPRPLVRSITCWSLSRFSKWLVKSALGMMPGPDGKPVPPEQQAQAKAYGQQQLDGVLSALLRRVLDNNKRVQEAACSAVATLEEEAGMGSVLGPRVEVILQHLMVALTRYQRKNLRILYDALGTLADAVGSALNQPRYIQALVPPLLEKWEQLGDHNRDLFPLLECLKSVTGALGPGFQPYAETVYLKSVSLIQQQLQMKVNGVEVEKEFVLCALDLMCVLVEGLGTSVESLVASSNTREMLLVLCADPHADVRQGAFELVGDLSKICASHLACSELFVLAQKNLAPEVLCNPENMSASNNACWAVGEMAVKMSPQALVPLVPLVAQHLIPMLSEERLNKSLKENTTITIGRLGLMCPEQVAPALGSFMHPWCMSLRNIQDDIEKEHAFLGLCAMLHQNPSVGLASFVPLCLAVASWQKMVNQDLHAELGKILRAYKDYLKDDWPRVWGSLEAPVRGKLGEIYGLGI